MERFPYLSIFFMFYAFFTVLLFYVFPSVIIDMKKIYNGSEKRCLHTLPLHNGIP